MIVVLLLAAVLLALLVALITLPRWFVRGFYRHRLWRLRDRLVDDVLAGRLPRHPAVLAAINDVPMHIRMSSRATIVDLIIVWRLQRQLSVSAAEQLRREVKSPSAQGLDAQARELLERHRYEQARILTETILFGSWLGLTMMIFFVIATWFSHRRPSLQAAADAARNTRLGQATFESVRKAPRAPVGRTLSRTPAGV